ncbi:AAA family ATPase [Nocardia pseudobrasiliensis]|uniref:Nuclease SbcCD subunit C n=1 Tax=Nocardia pseudobrasiliensis TaxID=45979 RepID=A0A370HKF2_9NOCA|nr:AAA family ATPase [Nocardia pseudobrasiliensis]RDI59056.1 exonuclease SbcC [Nocardia pseudobrasiliensis]
MRLHRLEVTAFGPFAETAVVDFDELGADGLFLLHGQTGAGKTTVLDAIAFALYGRVPGARGESKRLHSDHADPQTPPRVLLEATLGGRRLRLIRSPEFERPKKRGTGYRTEQAAATLEWLDGRGQNLSRIPDIGDEVVRLLGMSADQFFQVVLLPQGDFARFLRADNEDRERLLEKLFDTERFGVAEQWLAQRRRDSAAELEIQRQNIDRLTAQVGLAGGVGPTEAVGPLEAVEWSQRLLADARTHLTETTAELQRCQRDSAQAHTTAEHQRRLHDLHRRLATARAQLAEFTATADQRARRRTELDRARRAEPVADSLAEARNAAVTVRRRADETHGLAERLADRLLEPASAELSGTYWAATDLANTELSDTNRAEELRAIPPLAADTARQDGSAAGYGHADAADRGESGDTAAPFEVVEPDETSERPEAAAPEELSIPGNSQGAADANAEPGLFTIELAEPCSDDAEPGLFALVPLDRPADNRPLRAVADANTTAQPQPGITSTSNAPERPAEDGRATRPVADNRPLRTVADTGATAQSRPGLAPTTNAAEPQGIFSVGGGAQPAGPSDATNGIDTAIQRWTAQVGALDEVRIDADSSRRLAAELAEMRKEQGRLTERIAKVSARRAQLPDAIRSAEVRLREAADAVAELPGLAADCERLRAAATAAVELVRVRQDSARAEAAHESARAAHNDARERTLDIRERRLAGMAAELAGALVEGDPCGVCGSTEHPAPARAVAAAASKDDEERAVAAERLAETARDRALAQLTDLQRRIEILVERGGDGDKAELTAALNTVTARYESASTSATRHDDLTVELARLRTEDTGLQEELREAQSHASAVAERILAADRRLAEVTDRLRIAAGADGTVERRRARLDALIADATALRAARTETASAREHLTAAARRVEVSARSAGLVVDAETVVAEGASEPDYAALATYAKVVDAATRTPQQQAEIDAELTAADRTRAHAEAVLAEPDIQTAATSEPGDLDTVESLVAQSRTRLDAAVAAHAEATRRVAQLEELGGQLWAAVDHIAPAQSAHEELAELADVVAGRGANNRKMSLRSYVLAARLEEVALAGSVRLRRMSGGRYEFVHSDAAGPRGRRGGLGLDIRDDYTGAVRPAKTLSGGETFMASLALALGLADVVAAESGGLVLDTLFIDEGFGSLDADTLDAVMGVLDELRSGGRVVGVVSHVDEMRQRIPSRLHVIRQPTGSRLRTIVA